MTRIGLIAGTWLALTGCASEDPGDAQHATEAQDLSGGDGAVAAKSPGTLLAPPAVYTLSNDGTANQVASYLRAPNGSLSPFASTDTGGRGGNLVAASQGTLAFSAKLQRFFAVNAGDGTISMLSLDDHGALSALSTVPSGGTGPVSITVHDHAVYVVNQGALTAEPGTAAAANITGFSVYGNRLVPIAGSTQALSAPSNVFPTDIAFTPDGKFLVVAEVGTNLLDTFKVVYGVAQAGKFQASAGMEPFAFDFSPEGFLVVAEIGVPGAAAASSVSSYRISDSGTLTPITSALPIFQDAACWLVAAGRFAYIANLASSTLTGVKVSRSGEVTLLDASGVTATSSSLPIDLAVSPDHAFLYSLTAGANTINVFALGADGGLTAQPALPDVPVAATGLVAR